MITRKQAEAIQAKCDAATPGPWYQFSHKYGSVDCGETPQVFRALTRADETLIKASRADLPAVTASLVEAMEVIRRLVDGVDQWNESAQEIIGRIPDYRWGDLEGARALLAAWDKEEGDGS